WRRRSRAGDDGRSGELRRSLRRQLHAAARRAASQRSPVLDCAILRLGPRTVRGAGDHAQERRGQGQRMGRIMLVVGRWSSVVGRCSLVVFGFVLVARAFPPRAPALEAAPPWDTGTFSIL